MTRSFTDRVLGGVCGGLATRLPINAWGVRLLFALGAIATLGLMIPLYAILWVLLPQESLIAPQRLGFIRFIGFLLMIGLAIGLWWAILTQAYTPLIAQIPNGIGDLIARAMPVLLILIGLGFFLRGRVPLGNIVSLVISLALVGGVATMAYGGRASQVSTDQNLTLNYPIEASVTLFVVNVSATTTQITINTAPQTNSVTGTFVGSLQSTITQTKTVTEQGVGEMTIAETKSADFPRLNDIGRGTLDLTLPANIPLVLNIVNQSGDVTLSLGDLQLERLTLTIAQGDAVVSLPSHNPLSLRSEERPSSFNLSSGNLTLLIPASVDARLIYSSGNITETPSSYIESREAGLTILRPNPDSFSASTAPRLFYEISIGGSLRVQVREDG
ncbi:MAG: PspC domain-containing protein [Phototrophicales bacterium]|nr:PspC domain-containing protein [Phototrophicales bacterium]